MFHPDLVETQPFNDDAFDKWLLLVKQQQEGSTSTFVEPVATTQQVPAVEAAAAAASAASDSPKEKQQPTDTETTKVPTALEKPIDTKPIEVTSVAQELPPAKSADEATSDDKPSDAEASNNFKFKVLLTSVQVLLCTCDYIYTRHHQTYQPSSFDVFQGAHNTGESARSQKATPAKKEGRQEQSKSMQQR